MPNLRSLAWLQSGADCVRCLPRKSKSMAATTSLLSCCQRWTESHRKSRHLGFKRAGTPLKLAGFACWDYDWPWIIVVQKKYSPKYFFADESSQVNFTTTLDGDRPPIEYLQAFVNRIRRKYRLEGWNKARILIEKLCWYGSYMSVGTRTSSRMTRVSVICWWNR